MFPFLTYEFRVQADCFEGDYVEWSEWSDWHPFTLNPFLYLRQAAPTDIPNDLKELEIFDTENILTSYPNPSRGNVNLKFGVDETLATKVVITDISGRTVEEVPVTLSGQERPSINLEELKDGLYFIRLYKDGILLTTEKVLLTK